MKRLLTLLLALLLAGTSVFLLNACRDTPDDPDVPTDATLPLTDENGAWLYTIVRSDYATAKSMETTSAVRLRKALNGMSEKEISILTDWENEDDNAGLKEILVGKTNRRESIDALEGLAANEYLIRVSEDGNKIVIVGGSDVALDMAIDAFLTSLVQTAFSSGRNIISLKVSDMKKTFNNSEKIVILSGNTNVTYVEALKSALHAVTGNVTVADFSTPENEIFDTKKTGLLIFAGADRIPGSFKNRIQSFLNDGGRLMTLGGPAFTEELYESNGKWLNQEQYLFSQIEALDDDQKVLLFDTSVESVIKKFSRSTNTPNNHVELSVEDYGHLQSDAQLCVEVDHLDSWEMICGDFSTDLQGLTTLGFSAMGESDTPSLYVEIREKDGTRWYSSVSLSNDWEFYTLSPDDFTFWDGPASRKGGKPVFDDLKTVCFGFAQSGRSIPIGHHIFYLADPSLYQLDIPDFDTGKSLAIDGLYPAYELFPVTNAAHVVTLANQSVLTDRTYHLPSSVISCSPGRQGTGFGNQRTSRFIPLLEITDEKGLHAGYAAWINLFSSTTTNNGKMEGSVVGCFTATSNDFYDANGLQAIAEAARAMLQPMFLVEGGTDEYIYVASDTKEITVGASFVDLNMTSGAGATLTLTLYRGDKALKEYKASASDCKKSANDILTYSSAYDLSAGNPDRVVTVLTAADGTVVDKIEQTIKFWSPKPESERRYITAEDGYFKRNGEIISFFGVNYMPSSGIAEPNGNYFEHYVSAAAYDPDVIHNDLLRIKDLGMNAVSVFIHGGFMDSNNMLDLITQCEELGIYVDLSIRTATNEHLFCNEAQIRDLIKVQHFEENDNIIAYDIAWEPRIGTYEKSGGYIGRKDWDGAWREWIAEQYGSVANAEKAWGCSAPRDGSGKVIGVTDAMLDATSRQYDKIVAAYRRFVDDQVAKEFNDTFAYMRTVDPNHLYSFRMSMSGSAMTTASMQPSGFCFDFQSLASTASFMEPEGYALNYTNDESMLQILFANTYARYTQPTSPVVWKEYGKHAWTGSNFGDNSVALEQQSGYYEEVLEYCYNSYTSGMFCWYYAGGYRINENSDYGILNPDGSDRPATAWLRKYAPLIIGQGERKPADVLITVERDDSNRGIFAMFDATKSQLRTAYDGGKTVAFITKKQSTDSEVFYADTVLNETVGGTAATGLYPFRYINGQIKGVETFTKNGKTYARVTVCNTQMATWRAGTVSLVSTDASKISVNVRIEQEVGYLDDVTLEFELPAQGALALRLSIDGKLFGTVWKTTVS